jgi:prepilin-type N-terminal cleavage/methylation domain-containing protein
MLIKNKKNSTDKGFTLIETLVGTAIFLLLVISVYQTYLVTIQVIRTAQIKTTATALANEQLEIMRNMPYADIGIIEGLPSGKILADQKLIRNNQEFTVKTTINSIDDPFDGTMAGIPNDSSPSDYKLVEVEIICASCKKSSTLTLATYIAPQ